VLFQLAFAFCPDKSTRVKPSITSSSTAVLLQRIMADETNNENDVQIEGTYKLERNENLDDYFRTVGVPYLARKMMLTSSPEMFVTYEPDTEIWVFKTVTFFRTITQSFKLDEPYTEVMPSGDELESVTSRAGPSCFIIKSTHERIGSFERIFDFSKDELVITMKHSKGVQAKRFFKRVKS